jgi:LasA protease
MQLPFSNQMFLYGRDAEAFDVENYLALNAPALRSKAEVITHWAGYYSINPKVVLALAEMKSGVLTAPNKRNLQAPFGDLSRARGFDKQLRDVLHKLSQNFYGFEGRQRTGDKRMAMQSNVNGATAAIVGTLAAPATRIGAAEQGASLDAFTQQFKSLFREDADKVLAMEAEVPMAAMAMVPPTNMMQMPWRQGYSWKSNGAHSHTGSGWPLSSIDVSYDWPGWGALTYSVTAAHAGTVQVLSRCQVRITNPNGWATNYYHMDQIQVSNGQWVTANTKLGVYASSRNAALCQGGSSTGPHLHFSLLNNGRYVSLQGVNFGEYRVNVGTYNYDNNCSRFWFTKLSGGYQCAWSAMYNSGPWTR